MKIEHLEARRARALDRAHKIVDADGPTAELDFEAAMDEVKRCDAWMVRMREEEARNAENAAARAPIDDIVRPRGGDYTTSKHARFWLPTTKEYRAALAEGSGATGGYVVPIEQAKGFFDMLRARSVVLAANPRLALMTTDSMTIPKILSSTTSGWFNEAAQLSSTEMTFEQVTLTARKLAAYCLISNEALADSTPSIRDIVAYDFATSMALALDAAFLEGSGAAPIPDGMRNMTGVTPTAMGANGAALTMDAVLEQIGRVLAANGNLATCSFFCAPRTYSDLCAMKDDEGHYLMQPDTTAGLPSRLFGIPVRVSSQISITEEQGSSGAVTSYLMLADMDQIVVGRREETVIKFDESIKFDYDQTAVRATSRWDIQPINAAAIDVLDGITS